MRPSFLPLSPEVCEIMLLYLIKVNAHHTCCRYNSDAGMWCHAKHRENYVSSLLPHNDSQRSMEGTRGLTSAEKSRRLLKTSRYTEECRKFYHDVTRLNGVIENQNHEDHLSGLLMGSRRDPARLESAGTYY